LLLLLLLLPLLSAADGESKSTRLVTVAVVQAWNPPSLHLAKGQSQLRL